jgi:hypothetical protein
MEETKLFLLCSKTGAPTHCTLLHTDKYNIVCFQQQSNSCSVRDNVDQIVDEPKVLFLRLYAETWEVNEETRAEVPAHPLQTGKVNVVAKVSARIAADVHFVPPLLKFSNHLFKVDFGLDRFVQFHALAYFFASATITVVVGNAKVFVVVTVRLQQIHFVVADSHVKVQCVTLLCTALLTKLADVQIDVLHCYIQLLYVSQL